MALNGQILLSTLNVFFKNRLIIDGCTNEIGLSELRSKFNLHEISLNIVTLRIGSETSNLCPLIDVTVELGDGEFSTTATAVLEEWRGLLGLLLLFQPETVRSQMPLRTTVDTESILRRIR